MILVTGGFLTFFENHAVVSSMVWEAILEFLEDKYSLLYRPHSQSLLVSLPCYVIIYVGWGISFEEITVSLGCYIIGIWHPINKNMSL